MEEKKDLYRISERLYNSLEILDNQEAYKTLLNIYDLTGTLSIDEIKRVIKRTTSMIEDDCCDHDVCPYCGEHLDYHSTYEDDTNSYYNRYYYCNECKFRKDID